MDTSTDQVEGHTHVRFKTKDAIQLLRPRDLVGRDLPGEAAGRVEALALCGKCLLAPHLLLRAQILAPFGLLTSRDVLERHQSPALGMARKSQRMCVQA